ncbi:MAG: hypothetical protein CVV07_02940 [Gammaproteobacteria bacterium HGW-Gammaproteobacteria-11]|nr:MAG: hypothetical protein CVV07_02940 [Gammaproteobacteria bacterium HGW-Gammaproteobacteria-11]
MPFIRLLLLAFLLLELASLIVMGQRTGVGMTLLWVLFSAVLGVLIIKSQGWAMLQRLQQRMTEDRSPFGVLKSGMWGVLAGLLLVFPGLITDLLALPCLFLAWRHRNDIPPGEPGGPTVWSRDGHHIIEGEWQPGDDGPAKPERQIERE